MANGVIRWDPFDDFRAMRRVMDRAWPAVGAEPSEFAELSLAVDVYEKDGQLVLRAAVPGAKPEDVKVELKDNVVTISTETKAESDVKDGDWHRREVRYGKASRAFRLPTDLDQEQGKATFENGMLVLTFPKAAPRPRATTIPVQAKA